MNVDRSRRAVLTAVGVGGFSAVAGCLTSSGSETIEPSEKDHSLERWVDEVPRPPTAEPSGTKDGKPYYEIEMREAEQKLHRDLPPTTIFGYNGQFPGPTIESRKGEPIYVRWQNALPDEHILPVDTTVYGDTAPYHLDSVWATTHLHGGNVAPEDDGQSMTWFSPDFDETGPKFEKKDYYYPNDQPASTLWYHDHAKGITRLNGYAGLAGLYIIRSDHEESLGLPEGEYEVPLVFQDRSFNEDGSLYYPSGPEGDNENLPEPSIVPAWHGDTSLVNGKAWPRLTVEPRKYRFRMLNGANSRYYRLKLFEYNKETKTRGDSGPVFVGIGNDGGLLREPITVDDRVEMGPAQRFDVVVDFSEYAGETLLLHNDAPAQYSGSGGVNPTDDDALTDIMLVDVADTTVDDPSQVPAELSPVPVITMEDVDNERFLPLVVNQDDYGRVVHQIGTEENHSGYGMEDPITEQVTSGDIEVWSLANYTGMSHPMHLHVVHYQLLGRESISDYEPAENDIDPEQLNSPEPYELGWNDTITVDPGEVVHIAVPFGEFDGVFEDKTGEYMWHCHMLEHEEFDMMRPFEILQADADTISEEAATSC